MNYPGNKKIYGVYHKIINEIPLFDEYNELFFGSGAIGKQLMKLNTDEKIIYHFNDIDRSVVDKFIYKDPFCSADNFIYHAPELQTFLSTIDAADVDKNNCKILQTKIATSTGK